MPVWMRRPMSASLIGRSGSSTFRLSTAAVLMSLAGSRFSSESAPRPFHHGVRRRGGTIYWAALPSSDGRSKRTYELTSSIVPRGTSFHRLVELECSPVRLDTVRYSCGRDLPGPAELGAVNPDAVQDHGQPPCQGDDRLLHPAAPGNLHRPGLEPGPSCRTQQHALGRLVEHDPHHLVSASRYRTGSIALARLVLGGCQSKHRPDGLGVAEAGRHVNSGAISQRNDGADTGDCHQAPTHVIVPDHGQHAAMQDADLFA